MKNKTIARMLSIILVSMVLCGVCFGEAAANPKDEIHCFFCDATDNLNEVAPWLEAGADLRLREVYANNVRDFNNNTTTDEFHFQRYRLRTWASVKFLKMMGCTEKQADDITLNMRLTYEPRTIIRPKATEDFIRNEVIIDNLNLRWANALGLEGLTVTVGRQDLDFGNRWLIFEGTPGDGTRTLFFDAARLTYEQKETNTTYDLIYMHNDARSDWWLKPVNDQHTLLNTYAEDTQGAIFYVSNKSLKDTTLEGYFIYKHDNMINSPVARDIYTVGARAAGNICPKVLYDVEIAKQFGKNGGASINALGANSKLAYSFEDANKNLVFIGYEYRSGDDDSSSNDENFDILWGRWAQWSDAYLGNLDRADGRGPASGANLHRITLGWSTTPCPRANFVLLYSFLFADQNPTQPNALLSGNDNFRAQVVATHLTYKFNHHLTGRLTGEVVFPGGYYKNILNDPAVFTRAELVFRW